MSSQVGILDAEEFDTLEKENMEAFVKISQLQEALLAGRASRKEDKLKLADLLKFKEEMDAASVAMEGAAADYKKMFVELRRVNELLIVELKDSKNSVKKIQVVCSWCPHY